MKWFIAAIAIGSAMLSVADADTMSDHLTLDQLREKYALKGSKYIEAADVEIHYTDEGEGEPVVILHASFLNLNSWNDVANSLKKHFRVIRLDFPNMGLSENETVFPDADEPPVNFIDRNADVVEAFVDALGLDRFHLVATSSGGSIGFRAASRMPDRIKRLVLINSAGLPRTPQTDPNRDKPENIKYAEFDPKPLDFWRLKMDRNIVNSDEAPDWFVELSYDLNRRTPPPAYGTYVFETGDPQRILAGIRAPTMIIWGKNNSTVVHLEADVFQHWMTGAPSLIRKYENTGHYPYIEFPDKVADDLISFLTGELDDELRQTQMIRVDTRIND